MIQPLAVGVTVGVGRLPSPWPQGGFACCTAGNADGGGARKTVSNSGGYVPLSQE